MRTALSGLCRGVGQTYCGSGPREILPLGCVCGEEQDHTATVNNWASIQRRLTGRSPSTTCGVRKVGGGSLRPGVFESRMPRQAAWAHLVRYALFAGHGSGAVRPWVAGFAARVRGPTFDFALVLRESPFHIEDIGLFAHDLSGRVIAVIRVRGDANGSGEWGLRDSQCAASEDRRPPAFASSRLLAKSERRECYLVESPGGGDLRRN